MYNNFNRLHGLHTNYNASDNLPSIKNLHNVAKSTIEVYNIRPFKSEDLLLKCICGNTNHERRNAACNKQLQFCSYNETQK